MWGLRGTVHCCRVDHMHAVQCADRLTPRGGRSTKDGASFGLHPSCGVRRGPNGGKCSGYPSGRWWLLLTAGLRLLPLPTTGRHTNRCQRYCISRGPPRSHRCDVQCISIQYDHATKTKWHQSARQCQGSQQQVGWCVQQLLFCHKVGY